MAERYFGHTDVLGEDVFLKDAGKLTITAVVEDPPLNSHFHYQALISISSLPYMDHFFEHAFGPGINWQSFESQHFSFLVWTYLKTRNNFNASEFIKNEWPEHVKNYHSGGPAGYSLYPRFQPFRDIHLHSNFLYENSSGNVITRAMNIQIIIAFIFVAIFLLLVSAINYTNFSISQFNKRKRSLGMSMIVGGGSRDIFAGFFVESFLTSLVALILALFLLELLKGSLQVYWMIFNMRFSTGPWSLCYFCPYPGREPTIWLSIFMMKDEKNR